MDVKIRKSKLLRYRIIALLYIVFVSLVFLAQDSGFILSSKHISDYLSSDAESRHNIIEDYERVERHRFLFDPELENLGIERFRENVDSTIDVLYRYRSSFMGLTDAELEDELNIRELKRKSYSTVFFHVNDYLDSVQYLLTAYSDRVMQLSQRYSFKPDPYIMTLDSLIVAERAYAYDKVFFRSKSPTAQVLLTFGYLENDLRAKESRFVRDRFLELEEKRFKDSLNADEIRLNPELLLFNPERRNKFFRGESILVQHNVDSIYGINLNLYHYERGQRQLVRNVQFQEYSDESQFEMILDDIGSYDLEFTVLLDNAQVYTGTKQIQVFDDRTPLIMNTVLMSDYYEPMEINVPSSPNYEFEIKGGELLRDKEGAFRIFPNELSTDVFMNVYAHFGDERMLMSNKRIPVIRLDEVVITLRGLTGGQVAREELWLADRLDVQRSEMFDDQRENLNVEGFTCFILHPGYDLGVYEFYKNEGLFFSPELLKRFREVKRKEVLIFSNFKANLRNGTPIKVDPLIFVVQ